MDAPRTQRFLIVENDAKYAQWLQHTVSAGWPNDSIVIMDWTSFGRVRTAMTVRDYDIVMLALAFDEGIEDPTTDSFDWIRKLRSQPGFPGDDHPRRRRQRARRRSARCGSAPPTIYPSGC